MARLIHRPERAQKALFCLCLTLLLVDMAAGPAQANRQDADLCDQAAQVAARSTGTPLGVLRAIALTETGRTKDGQLQPWPWTVNMQGKGIWFDTPQAALDYVRQHYRQGARSFDIGCFQINHRWHGQAFATIDAMFDPRENALYAARFLADLYKETGDWSRAAGAYHSRKPENAQRYRNRFDRLFAQVADTAERWDPAPQAPQTPRLNAYPLLKADGKQRGMGSLVPFAKGQRLFGRQETRP